MLVKFEIYKDGKFWCARGIGEDIFTQGKTMDELMKNIGEAVLLHFDEDVADHEPIKIITISETEVGRFAKASSS
ncbi:MAG: type II toxin-antitoxin system HicB family antitoxin [Euryarchaeota archaeon]|nr:type II toxin-antitoxin system HicB family antitoxin [Euryarchaeota archaeon]